MKYYLCVKPNTQIIIIYSIILKLVKNITVKRYVIRILLIKSNVMSITHRNYVTH